LFEGMEFADDYETLKEWISLMMEGREPGQDIAATKIDTGTDVNFGALSRKLFSLLEEQNVEMNYNHSVEDLKQLDNNKWQVTVKNQNTGKTEYHMSDFVFIGAAATVCRCCRKQELKSPRTSEDSL